jgi:hypothetical protein
LIAAGAVFGRFNDAALAASNIVFADKCAHLIVVLGSAWDASLCTSYKLRPAATRRDQPRGPRAADVMDPDLAIDFGEPTNPASGAQDS